MKMKIRVILESIKESSWFSTTRWRHQRDALLGAVTHTWIHRHKYTDIKTHTHTHTHTHTRFCTHIHVYVRRMWGKQNAPREASWRHQFQPSNWGCSRHRRRHPFAAPSVVVVVSRCTLVPPLLPRIRVSGKQIFTNVENEPR